MEHKILNWNEYCVEIFMATVEEVEEALRMYVTEQELDGYRKAEYIVVDTFQEPEYSFDEYFKWSKETQEEASKQFPDFDIFASETFYDASGTQHKAIVAIKGAGLVPFSLSFD